MILLFRKLRNTLLKQNKVTTYFLYAIGEIFLVVVGILIAINIDNLNERNKEQAKVKVLVTSLIKELEFDNKNIVDEISKSKVILEENEYYLNRIIDPKINMDTIINIVKYQFKFFWLARYEMSSNASDNMHNSGLFELLPDTIKIQINNIERKREYYYHFSEKVNLQYQQRFDEFTKTYIVAGGNTKFERLKSLPAKLSWENIDEKHFVTSSFWMISTRRRLWITYLDLLEDVSRQNKTTLNMLKKYNKNI